MLSPIRFNQYIWYEWNPSTSIIPTRSIAYRLSSIIIICCARFPITFLVIAFFWVRINYFFRFLTLHRPTIIFGSLRTCRTLLTRSIKHIVRWETSNAFATIEIRFITRTVLPIRILFKRFSWEDIPCFRVWIEEYFDAVLLFLIVILTGSTRHTGFTGHIKQYFGRWAVYTLLIIEIGLLWRASSIPWILWISLRSDYLACLRIAIKDSTSSPRMHTSLVSIINMLIMRTLPTRRRLNIEDWVVRWTYHTFLPIKERSIDRTVRNIVELSWPSVIDAHKIISRVVP